MAKSTKKGESSGSDSGTTKPAAGSARKTAAKPSPAGSTSESATNAGKPAAAQAGGTPKKQAGGKAPSAAKPATPKPTAATSFGGGNPSIDTSLAAESAAKMLAAGLNRKNLPGGTGAGSGSARPESAMFKQLKAGLSKPAAGAMGNLLDKTHGPGAGAKPGHGFGKQVGHNQTFGADVNRTGVPRRTNG